MRTIVIEPFHAGHRPVYVRWIAQALVRAGADVVIVGGAELIRHAELRALLADDGRPSNANQSNASQSNGSCEGIALAVPSPVPARPGRVGQWRFELGMRKWLESAYAAASNNTESLVVLPYVDYCFHAIAALGSPFGTTRWCAITMRTEFTTQSRSFRLAMRHVLLRRMLAERTLIAMFSIDPRSQRQPHSLGGDTAFRKLKYLADPAEMGALPGRETARRLLNIETGRRTLLLFGSIDLRKGLQEMLHGVAECADASQWSVIIAGKQTTNAKEVIASLRQTTPAYSLHVIDEVVGAEVVPSFFACADVVWVGYPGHRAMSGVLVQAALAGRPVVAQKGTLIGDLVSHAGIGVACDVSHPAAVAEALQRASSPAMVVAARLSGPTQFAGHTPEAFGAKIVRTLFGANVKAAISDLGDDLSVIQPIVAKSQ